jgi:hypothetical protein
MVAEGVREQVPGAAVEIGGTDEIVAGLAEVLDREGRCRLARARASAATPPSIAATRSSSTSQVGFMIRV